MRRLIKTITKVFKYSQQAKKRVPSVFSWGEGDKGNLGHNTTESVSVPKAIPPRYFREKKINKVVTSGCATHCYAFATDGSIFTWGNNFHGQMGIGDYDNSLGPYFIEDEIFSLFKDIKCGESFSLGLTHDGDLYSWGYGGTALRESGLGYHQKTSKLSFFNNTPTPQKIPFFEENKLKVKSISAGASHSIALCINGDVYSWGNGLYGRLGLGNNKGYMTPKKIDSIHYNEEIVKKVSAGTDHSAILTHDGNLYTFGRNDNFQLGIETTGVLIGGAAFDSQSVPFPVVFFQNEQIKVEDVATGGEFTAVITTTGDAYIWGKQTYVPTHLTEITDAISVSVGENHMVYLTENGAYIMGNSNWNGQIGVDKEVKDTSFSPKRSFKLDGTKYIPKKIKQVSCGVNFTLAVI